MNCLVRGSVSCTPTLRVSDTELPFLKEPWSCWQRPPSSTNLPLPKSNHGTLLPEGGHCEGSWVPETLLQPSGHTRPQGREQSAGVRIQWPLCYLRGLASILEASGSQQNTLNQDGDSSQSPTFTRAF